MQLQMCQKVKIYSKSYEIQVKFLKPDFHLKLFYVLAKKDILVTQNISNETK